jgi:hypothetical protein
MTSELLPGTEVEARGLRWELIHVQPAGSQQLFRLRCLEGPLLNEQMEFLVPFEKVEAISKELDPERAANLAHWTLYHQAFLLEQALGPRALSAAQPGRLSIAPYQIVPVMRALRMSRVRLMLADGVGLGKTVQAGLVMAELIARCVPGCATVSSASRASVAGRAMCAARDGRAREQVPRDSYGQAFGSYGPRRLVRPGAPE